MRLLVDGARPNHLQPTATTMIIVTRVTWIVNAPGTLHAHVQVLVPAHNAPAIIEMGFPTPAEPNRDDWAETAYEKSLVMLDPA